ncbi:hypothetical protein LC087_11940 [Bacillus carboniphilus]|uniref:SWIM-type domain-containing protein n=1 Tax=Bacillus carboniphilus TaxID=86663 RepID=A0ABY9JQJ0_9BACI|nr:hypothetical protein [Bacillus carboniphilus]WLR41592.1 hypothetical protein LC087_11940 [Bacillus carboniphilus]
MPTYGIPKDSILACSYEILDLLIPEKTQNQQLMKEGVRLYRENRIYQASIEFLTAKIQDKGTETVKLSLNHFRESSCTCKEKDVCSHMIAFFLYLYSKINPIENYISQWSKSNVNNQLSMYKEMHLLQTLGLAEEDGEMDEASVDLWYKQFDIFYKEWERGVNKENIDNLADLFYRRYYIKLRRKASDTYEHRHLYLIHVALISFMKLTTLLKELHVDEENLINDFTYYANKFLVKMNDLLHSLQRSTVHQSQIIESMGPFRELLLCDGEFYYPPLYLYRKAWSTLFNQKEWLTEEKKRLSMMKDPATKNVSLAIAHLEFLLENDHVAFQLLSQHQEDEFDYSLLWFEESLVKEKNWNRFKMWISFICDHVTHLKEKSDPYNKMNDSIEDFLRYLHAYTLATGDEALYERFCQQTFPISYDLYHTYLLDKQKYQQWTELQILFDYHTFDIDDQIIDQIVNKDPKAALPILHQKVDKLIQKRRRPSYQEAIYYLNMIRRAYDLLMESSAWDDYLTFLRLKYKHYRTFHKELKKGLLLNE